MQGVPRWRDPDSNRGHHDFQSCALPTELSRRNGWIRVARDGRYRGGGAPPSRPAARRRARASRGGGGARAAAARPRRRRGSKGGYDPSRSPTCPPASADVVFDLDTREPLVALAVEQFAPRVTNGALTADQVARARRRARRGGDRRRQGMAGLRYRRAGAPSQRRRGGRARATAWSSSRRAPRTCRRALDDARAPAARYARATFDKRFAGLPADAGARVAFDPRVLLGQRSPELAATRVGRARCATAPPCSTTRGTELRVPFRITARPRRPDAGRPADRHRPAAAAALAEAPRSSPACATRRTRSRSRAQAGLLSELGLLDQLPGFLKPDLSDLGPNGTVTSPSLDLTRHSPRASSRRTPATGRPSSAVSTRSPGSPARRCSAA